MASKRLWSIETHGGLRTQSLDPSKRFGQRRTYERLQGRITLRFEIDECAWRAFYEVEVLDGRPLIREVRVVPVDEPTPPAALPSGDLRALTSASGEALERVLPLLGEARLWRLDAEPEMRRHQPKGDYWRAIVASTYAAHVHRGSPHPNVDTAKQLAEHFGNQYSTRYITDLLSKARKRGLLEPTTKGRHGGRLTAHGHKVLLDGPPNGYGRSEELLAGETFL